MVDMSDTPVKRRRWFQFRLRTLLVVVTVAAVASWGYWMAWPWLYSYLERRRFELAASQIKAGATQKNVTTALADYQPAGRPYEVSDLIADHILLFGSTCRTPAMWFGCDSRASFLMHYRGLLVDELQGKQNIELNRTGYHFVGCSLVVVTILISAGCSQASKSISRTIVYPPSAEAAD
jgi:hypothetical protein